MLLWTNVDIISLISDLVLWYAGVRTECILYIYIYIYKVQQIKYCPTDKISKVPESVTRVYPHYVTVELEIEKTLHNVTCRLYIPLHYRIGGGRVRRQRYTWSALTAGSLYQAAGNRAYHGVIAIGHW